MIYTCSYKNFKTNLYKGISISGDKGKSVNFSGNYFKELAPKKEFWTVWHNNIGKTSEEENNKYYIEEYYKTILSKLNPEKTYKELDNSFLLCYEDIDDFCHRHIVSAWFELFLGVEVNEVVIEGLKIDTINNTLGIKNILEQIIKENTNMRGFKSIRALYLFNKSEEFEVLANELEIKTGKNYDSYRQAACNMRCEADYEEDLYNQKTLTKINKFDKK